MSKDKDNFLDDEIKEENIETTEVEEIKEVKKVTKKEQFRVVAIINDKAVMVRSLKDNSLYSKPNKGYSLSEII